MSKPIGKSSSSWRELFNHLGVGSTISSLKSECIRLERSLGRLNPNRVEIGGDYEEKNRQIVTHAGKLASIAIKIRIGKRHKNNPIKRNVVQPLEQNYRTPRSNTQLTVAASNPTIASHELLLVLTLDVLTPPRNIDCTSATGLLAR